MKVKVNARWCCGGVCKNNVQVLVRLQEEAVVQEASEGTIDFVVLRPGRDGGIICLPRATSGDGVDAGPAACAWATKTLGARLDPGQISGHTTRLS
jgi:hypothetical protein